jgi:hypothetical protein
MEYYTSKTEISRRKKTFIAFILSFAIGLVLASIAFNFSISIIGYLCLAAAFLLIGVISFRSFYLLSKLKTQLTEQSLVQISANASEKYLLANVTKVNIKRTARGTIRELRIWFNDGKSTCVNALDDIEQFTSEFLSKIDKAVVVNKCREPLDFDHAVFYPILGLLLGAIGIYTFKVLANCNPQNFKIIFIAFSVYIMAVALYIILAKPISTRQGGKSHKMDYILGAIIICAAVFVSLIGFLEST